MDSPAVSTEALPETVSNPKPVGMEKLVVRLFKETFGRAALKSGTLRTTLDEFLRAVLNHKDASKSDKDYARKAYKDMSAWLGVSGLPDWASKKEAAEKGVSSQEIEELLANVDDPTPPPRPSIEDVGLTEDDFSAFVPPDTSHDDDPLLGRNSPLRIILTKFIEKMPHPPVEVFTLGGVRYAALGTMFGTIAGGLHQGKKLNVNCTINPYQSLTKVPDDILVYNGQRPLNIFDENEHGTRKYVYCCRHRPGIKIRYWSRLDDKDQSGGARFVVLTDDEAGFKSVPRNAF